MNFIKKEMKYASNNYKSIERTIIRGKGIYVYDTYNRAYIDCISGYSALNQGTLSSKIDKSSKRTNRKLTQQVEHIIR